MARVSDERWERIWPACEESVERLLVGDSSSEELAPVLELPVSVEPEEPS
jgi:hypothetical protein